MKTILKIVAFVTITILVSISIVIVHRNSQSKQISTSVILEDCVINTNNNCREITPKKPGTEPELFVPEQQLNQKDKFIETISKTILTVPINGTFEYILLKNYGAVFINQQLGVILPEKVIFSGEPETQYWQSTIPMSLVNGTAECYLQKPAAAALNQAKLLVNIPLKSGYAGDCTRDFATTVRFWQKYANSQTLDLVKQGRETKILSLVAPPGSSQHIWGLAIDLQVSTEKQRQALNENGWYQTVVTDLPHWTYLGWNEEQLPQFGLKKKFVQGIKYWVTPL
ncbi:D-alanyl-D-alanine carboxypeptidase family protein [Anabaena sp. FACHB-1237]|uniref:D-alanyl-D-alanine carboxypeptidase family protein n=1 Tax=Anabaena sp. FACHB-1237 TaxID=2692769 RepID=UPI001681A308|nr:D-alanyl-D-alanine carboxypeptidase family protein [Anabaena sp. FACHB-1237]MBD2137660.1 D-alanyl-D-alanine carboxypeptidase family protein [Anabaena sp. FACHB-1237]